MTCSTIFICIVVASTIITESNESQAMPNRTRRPQTHHLDRIALHSFVPPLIHYHTISAIEYCHYLAQKLSD
jgi:hypothetical protein